MIAETLAKGTSLSRKEVSSVGRFERLPKWFNCIPLVTQWLWLGLRHGSFTLPSTANPAITSGGLVGEGKLEYFDSMGALARSYTADYLGIRNEGSDSVERALRGMEASGIPFPLIVKPDLGWFGYGVRLIQNAHELADYFGAFPQGETVVLQSYLPDPGEAGIFYARHPDCERGKIIGIALRSFPQVIGDGMQSIGQLVAQSERMRRIWNQLHKPDFDPNRVPAAGEVVRLATIGSTRVGGLYLDGSEYIGPGLTSVMDSIAKDMKEFHVGRFDVRFRSVHELQAGEHFSIMEVNGAGSEAIFAWDPKYSIRESYRIIFAKQRLLFAISAANRRRGHRPISSWKLARLHLHQQKLINQYPPSN